MYNQPTRNELTVGIEPGVYFIVNTDGDKLAVEYGGRNTLLFVTKKKNVPAQKWIVSGDHTKLQAIAPIPARNFYTVPVGNSIQLIDVPYHWYVSMKNGAYTIQDADQHTIWSLDEVQAGRHVVLRKTGDAKYQSWTFIKTKV